MKLETIKEADFFLLLLLFVCPPFFFHPPKEKMLSEKTTDQMPLPWLPLPTTQSSLSDVARQIYDGSSFDQEWKDLRFIPWRFFYLDYHHLQKDIVYGNIAKRLETEWNKVKKS